MNVNKQVCVKPPSSALNRTLLAPAPAAQRPQLFIDISRLQVAQQQTCQLPLLLSIDLTDRQTPDHYIDPALHTMQAASIKK